LIRYVKIELETNLSFTAFRWLLSWYICLSFSRLVIAFSFDIWILLHINKQMSFEFNLTAVHCHIFLQLTFPFCVFDEISLSPMLTFFYFDLIDHW
jgi:hypothetical protein